MSTRPPKTSPKLLDRPRRVGAALLAAAAVAGVLPASSSAATCPAQPTAPQQVFSAFADDSLYSLVPGGNFEAGAPAWTLNGGQIVAGNESFFLGGASNARAVQLPVNKTAVSPVFCVGEEHPTMRLVARGTAGQLKVEALYYKDSGSIATMQLGLVPYPGNPNWQVSQVLPLATKLPGITTTTMQVQIRLTAQGSASTWTVDDVYYDPRVR
jgi:hypothetical protein